MIARARQLKKESYALYLAYLDPRTPWYAKAWALLVFTYAVSPIDLIPDFIPVLGYLDDLILIPAGITIAIKLIPPEVMADCREKAQTQDTSLISYLGAALILGIWLILVVMVVQAVKF